MLWVVPGDGKFVSVRRANNLKMVITTGRADERYKEHFSHDASSVTDAPPKKGQRHTFNTHNHTDPHAPQKPHLRPPETRAGSAQVVSEVAEQPPVDRPRPYRLHRRQRWLGLGAGAVGLN